MDFKKLLERFKAWQREPMHYENHNKGTIRCANCGAEVEANFCPICGQKSSVGRLTWATVRQNIAMLWGMESRTMPGTLLQLLLRPGYLISDYLDGKRQQFYPPVKMLIVVGIAVLLFQYFVSNIVTSDPNLVTGTSSEYIYNRVVDWGKQHPAWGGLALCALVELPTWFLFRFAPRHSRHTLPEGFFIQVFMAPVVIVSLSMTFVGSSRLIPIALYYIVAYRQLFGYNWWGTSWRTLLCLGGTFWLVLVSILIEMYVQEMDSRGALFCLFLALLMLAPVILGYYISKRTAKHRE